MGHAALRVLGPSSPWSTGRSGDVSCTVMCAPVWHTCPRDQFLLGHSSANASRLERNDRDTSRRSGRVDDQIYLEFALLVRRPVAVTRRADAQPRCTT